jgi:hypothetical protein
MVMMHWEEAHYDYFYYHHCKKTEIESHQHLGPAFFCKIGARLEHSGVLLPEGALAIAKLTGCLMHVGHLDWFVNVKELKCFKFKHMTVITVSQSPLRILKTESKLNFRRSVKVSTSRIT